MKRGPRDAKPSGHDFVARARMAWGAAPPDWVLVLAEQASASSGVIVARKLGYVGAVVSNVIRNKYAGDLARVEAKVRGALMGAEVSCPVLGVIGRHQCLDEQKKPFTAASSIRSKTYWACRGVPRPCPHSRLQQRED